jgi:5-methylthioadenosine/S-adenosylhomocysteine deaminase
MAPVVALRRAGVRMALATDWAPTNNGMDLFDEMKIAGLLNKLAAGDPAFLPVEHLLSMVTIDAARALGLDALIGSLEPGKRADVITIAMDGLHLQPWQNVPATLVYSAKGLDVRHVWVDGKWVVEDRRPLRADPHQVRSEVARIWRHLRSRTTV